MEATNQEDMQGETVAFEGSRSEDMTTGATEARSTEVTPRRNGAIPAAPCTMCGAEQSAIRINVDGNTLLMESCDNCDVRRWQLAGERIDLQEALNQVGEHSGRRRSKA